MVIYTPWVKNKQEHHTRAYNFAKYNRIFKVLSRAVLIIKGLTAPQTRRYTTQWNVNVKKLATVRNKCLVQQFNNKFVCNLLLLATFWLLFKMPSSGWNTGMETSAPLVNGIVNNALFHSNPRINIHQVIHTLHFVRQTHCWIVAQVLWSTAFEIMAVRQPQIWRDECVTVCFTQLLHMVWYGIVEFNVPLDTV